jgi:putative ABC transport system ATP-binding protein
MLLEMKQVHKAYGGGEMPRVEAARGVDLRIASRDFIALVGPSGSGKTTILNMLGALALPDSGEVLFRGQPLQTLSESARAAYRLNHVGFIFQNYQLLPMLTALENVMLVLHAKGVRGTEKRTRAETALEQVGMGRMMDRRPAQMSGGQQQRVSIARAIAGGPAVVLADEPTANLDSQTAQAIIDIFLDLNQTFGTTFFFSTHDERLIRQVGHVLHLKDGKF